MPIVNAYFLFNYFTQAIFFAVSWIGGHFAQKMKQQLVVSCPFLQSPDTFSGPKSNIQIEIERMVLSEGPGQQNTPFCFINW